MTESVSEILRAQALLVWEKLWTISPGAKSWTGEYLDDETGEFGLMDYPDAGIQGGGAKGWDEFRDLADLSAFLTPQPTLCMGVVVFWISVNAMQLNFLNAARRVFDPLAQRFNMRYTVGFERLLRHQSNVAFLNVHFDSARSLELGVEIGRMTTIAPERPFSLGEVMRLSGSKSEPEVDSPQVRNQASLESALNNLANLTSRFALRALLREGSTCSSSLASCETASGRLLLRTENRGSFAAWLKRPGQTRTWPESLKHMVPLNPI